MATSTFLSVLPFLEPVPAAQSVQALVAVAKQRGIVVELPSRDSTQGGRSFTLAFTPEFRDSRIQKFKETVPPARLANPDVSQALGRYNLRFNGVISSTGVCRIQYTVPEGWSKRARSICENELFFPFQELIKLALYKLEADGHRVFAEDYYITNCVFSSRPERDMRQTLMQTLAKNVEADCTRVIGPAVSETLKLTENGFKRAMVPIRWRKRYRWARKQTEEFLESKRLVKHFLATIALPLAELDLDWKDLWDESWSGLQSKSYEEFTDLLDGHHKSNREAINVLLGMSGLLLALLSILLAFESLRDQIVKKQGVASAVVLAVVLLVLLIDKNARLGSSMRASAMRFRRANPHLVDRWLEPAPPSFASARAWVQTVFIRTRSGAAKLASFLARSLISAYAGMKRRAKKKRTAR